MSCNTCRHFHCGNSITVGAADVTISFVDAPAGITDKELFCFRICTNIPDAAAGLPVLLSINGTTVPLWNKYGNPMIGANLRRNKLYKAYYGATTPHVIAFNTPVVCGC